MEKNQPLISVIIPCYNLGEYLEEAIISVIQQDYQNKEIIVVDDGSTDKETRKTIKNLINSYPKIKFYLKKNSGVASARNFGIEKSHGEYICCLDADDKYKSNFLSKTIGIFMKSKNAKLGIVSTDYEIFGRSQYLVTLNKFISPSQILVCNQLHVASLFKRNCWEKAHGYSNDPSGYQDWDFWIKCISHGFYWKIVSEPLFLYRDRENSMIKTSLKKHLKLFNILIKNNKKIYQKNAIEVIKGLEKHHFENEESLKLEKLSNEKMLKKLKNSNFFKLWQKINTLKKLLKLNK